MQLLINPNQAAVTGIEILDYVESYGYEVAEAALAQTVHWQNGGMIPIKLNQDIQNIGGATLSCKHLTDGVKRVAVLYEISS